MDLWYDVLSWSSSAIHIGIASGVPRQPLVLNVNDPSTFTACYEAFTVPLSDFARLQELIGDSELFWATPPSGYVSLTDSLAVLETLFMQGH